MGLFDYYNDTCRIGLYTIMVKKIILNILKFIYYAAFTITSFLLYVIICCIVIDLGLKLMSFIL
jgi:hypothetical protein